MSYLIILIPLATSVIAQLLKILLALINKQRLSIKLIAAYGGMPSSHTAFVVSTVLLAAIMEGFGSASFMVALTLAIIVIRDALGLRMHATYHGEILKSHVIDRTHQGDKRYEKVGERLGHYVPEVLVGALVGIFCTIILLQAVIYVFGY